MNKPNYSTCLWPRGRIAYTFRQHMGNKTCTYCINVSQPWWSSGYHTRLWIRGSRGRWIFKSVKILSMTSFGRAVKPWVPCRRFTARKRTSNRSKICQTFHAHCRKRRLTTWDVKSVVKPTSTITIFNILAQLIEWIHVLYDVISLFESSHKLSIIFLKMHLLLEQLCVKFTFMLYVIC